MKLTFLGTGTSQGIPVIGCECEVCLSSDSRDKRLRTSALLRSREGTTIVFDTGPDFRAQMLREGVNRLDAVLYTHAHRDHTAGLDDTRSFVFRQKKPMDIYADGDTLKSIRKDFSYVFKDEKYPGSPEVIAHEVTSKPFMVGAMKFIPIPVMHYKMPVLGYRSGNFAYITDANYISEASRAHLHGLDVLVLNALQREQHISHFNIDEAIQVVQDLQPRRAYFTHFSHRLGRHAAVSQTLPPGIEMAYDGLVVELD